LEECFSAAEILDFSCEVGDSRVDGEADCVIAKISPRGSICPGAIAELYRGENLGKRLIHLSND
jgi:hypothetical protein